MKDMCLSQIQSAFDRISAAKGKQKEIVLKEIIDEDGRAKSALVYLLNPMMTYGIDSKLWKDTGKGVTKYYYSIFAMLGELNLLSAVNDQTLRNVQEFIHDNEEYTDLITGMLSKSIKLGVTAKTVNKVAGYDLIPEFTVMLANKYFEHQEKVHGHSFTITEKLDGIRCAAILTDGKVKLFSRQGQQIFGLVEIEENLLQIWNDIGRQEMVFDGELIISDREKYPSKQQYKLTTQIVRKDGEKHGVTYNVFDVVEYDGFVERVCKVPYYQRRQRLSSFIPKPLSNVCVVPILYSGDDESWIMAYLNTMRSHDREGIMINLNDAVYEYKRTNALLKCKVMQDCDLKIIGVQEGSGKFAGTLGALLVDYKGTQVGVGSGLSDAMRRMIWSDPSQYIGRVATIQYFEETQDANGVPSIRFPVFRELREEGKEVSYS